MITNVFFFFFSFSWKTKNYQFINKQRLYWKSELVRRKYYLLKRMRMDQKIDNGWKKMCVFPYVKLYFFLSIFSFLYLLLPPLSVLLLFFLPLFPTLMSPTEVKYRQKNDENMFCSLLFLGGKLLESPPSFFQCVYTIWINMTKHRFLWFLYIWSLLFNIYTIFFHV